MQYLDIYTTHIDNKNVDKIQNKPSCSGESLSRADDAPHQSVFIGQSHLHIVKYRWIAHDVTGRHLWWQTMEKCTRARAAHDSQPMIVLQACTFHQRWPVLGVYRQHGNNGDTPEQVETDIVCKYMGYMFCSQNGLTCIPLYGLLSSHYSGVCSKQQG